MIPHEGSEREHNLLRAELVERRAEIMFLRSVERELRADHERLSSQNQEFRRVQDALAAQIANNETLQASVADLSHQMEALKQSLSWKITAPLRAVLDVALKLRKP